MTHPYYIAAAGAALRAAGADAPPEAVAAWAEGDSTAHGILVTRDGRILAETRHSDGAAYVITDGTELKLWQARHHRETGEQTAHLTRSQLTTGSRAHV